MGHLKNERHDGGGVDVQECFPCGWRGQISKDCPRRVRLAMQTNGGGKDKGRMGHGPEERRMDPNERGWIEKSKDIFDYSKSVEETIREMGTTWGSSGARP